MTKLVNELRDMIPTWAVTTILPLPIINFWQLGPGQDFAYAYLFLGSAILVAERFSGSGRPKGGAVDDWRSIVAALLLATATSAMIFTIFVWAIAGYADLSVPIFAVLAVIPAIGCVPFLAITCGRPYYGVLAAILLMTVIKLAGCVVVVLVYGWNAQEHGYTALPWRDPNLLVCLCLSGAMLSSLMLFALGRREFLRRGGSSELASGFATSWIG